MAPKRLRGRSRPGRRVSSARFATVSSPVYASIASGSAKAIECQVGVSPSEVPAVSASGEKSSARPSPTSSICVARSTSATISAQRCRRVRWMSRTTAIPAITQQPTTTSQGRWIFVKNAPAT